MKGATRLRTAWTWWVPVRATPDERTCRLPGDDLIANPLETLTHAVTIHAAPRDVWPWLAQMGAGRGGWYSYDVFDNGGQASATRIVPSLQHLEVGTVFPAVPGATEGFTLAAFERDRFLILEWKTPDGVRMVSWAFVLEPLDACSTRLMVRARGSGLMQGKQLRGIARRAEILNAVGCQASEERR